MKAIVWTKYGPPDVLQLKDVEKPAPKDNEVRIKIHATTVTAGDCEMRSLKFPLYMSLPMRIYVGFRKPKRITIPGMELAGEIEAVGKDVKLFKEGDQVFGTPGIGAGAYAEYICLPEKPEGMTGFVVIKPANMTYEEVAAVPTGGLEALHFLRDKVNIQSGQKVLINGAGGSIGTFGIQLARHFGAEVTAVDSTGKLDMLRSIGADQVIDYTQEDFTKNGQVYDLILDVVTYRSIFDYKRALSPKGIYVMLGGGSWARVIQAMFLGPMISMTGSKKMHVLMYKPNKKEDVDFMKELLEAGKVKPVIDRRYPLSEVAEALRYLGEGHFRGKVVITVEQNGKT